MTGSRLLSAIMPSPSALMVFLILRRVEGYAFIGGRSVIQFDQGKAHS